MLSNIEYAKSLSYGKIRSLYKSYLIGKNLVSNTVGTIMGDTFYLWNKEGKDVFWDTLSAEDFEITARSALHNSLTKYSSGNVDKLLNGYISNLRRFKTFINSLDVDSYSIEKDDMTAIKDFLLDIDCLEPLSEWTSKLNLFDILKITRVEIRHSNMLSWLINPNENHGMGDNIIRGFIQYVVTSFSEDEDIFNYLLMDFHDITVQREWHNIDIIAVSPDNHFVICIENKIDSKEHDDQLNRYHNIVGDSFQGYRKMFIYLSPDGEESSDSTNWCSMGYDDVLNIIESTRKKVQLAPETALLINNYIDTIRRDIVGDEKLAQICAEIYNKHQKALDLIFENKPDRASQLADIIHDWATMMTEKGEFTFVPEKSGKTLTKFKTKFMSELMPDADEALSGWGTHNFYFYEIGNNEGKEIYIQLALSSKNIPADLRKICDDINKIYPSKQQKTNWQWRKPFVTRHVKVDEDFSEAKVFEQLSRRFEEVKAFEKRLLLLLGDND